MCINLETSLLAFIIGTSSGYLLIKQSIERKMFGFFVIFYSLIQLFEAGIYYSNDNTLLYTKLIMINLGLQALVFFLSMNQIYKINFIYIILSVIIAIFMIICALQLNEAQNVTINNCINWNFFNYYISISLFLMYGLILYWYWIDNKNPMLSIDNDFIKNTGTILTATLIFSYFINRSCNSPGIWCLSSAIVAPIYLLL
jgi:hypothetical protein